MLGIGVTEGVVLHGSLLILLAGKEPSEVALRGDAGVTLSTVAELSVVIPVYGCDSCLRALVDRLRLAVESLTNDYELVFVDDRSPDDSWSTLKELARETPQMRLLRMSRNFGQHAAITAGLAESTGKRVVVMDCDLQDLPEDIPRLWAEAEKGYEVVLSRRRRRRQSILRRLSGDLYYRVRNVLVKSDMYTNYTNLSLISRKVVDSFLALRDKDRQYLLIVDWLGFERTSIQVEPAERHAGKSAYTLRRLLKVAVDGMFFQSTVLLRWVVYSGFVVAGIGVALAAYTFAVFIAGRHVPDWTALPMMVLFLTGFIIVSGGVTGLYVGKIFDQVKGRPLYVIDTRMEGGVERAVARELAAAADGEPAQPPA
jgi:polyisoprenyl-phosphate glycosyltransferase